MALLMIHTPANGAPGPVRSTLADWPALPTRVLRLSNCDSPQPSVRSLQLKEVFSPMSRSRTANTGDDALCD